MTTKQKQEIVTCTTEWEYNKEIEYYLSVLDFHYVRTSPNEVVLKKNYNACDGHVKKSSLVKIIWKEVL